MTRGALRAAGALLLVGALQVLGAAPAAAHAVLTSTDPAQNATLNTAPAEVTLIFNEPVEVSLGSIQVLDAAGRRVERGSVQRPGGDASRIRVQLQDGLGTGGYAVGYRVTSADGHPVRGAFTFGVGGGTGEDASAVADELLAGVGGGTLAGGVFAVVRWLGFASLVGLVGVAAFVVVVWPAGRGNPRVRRLLWGAWGALLGSTVLAVLLQGVYVSEQPLTSLLDPELIAGVAQTRFGWVHLARVGLLVLAAPAVRMLSRPAAPSTAIAGDAAAAAEPPLGGQAKGSAQSGLVASVAEDAMLLLALALLLTPGLAGHAGTGLLIPLALVTDTVHLAAIAVWLGGLVVLAVVVLPRRDAHELRTVVPRFSSLAFGAVVVVVASGLVQSWRQVGTLDGLVAATFGRLLVAKLVVVAVLVGVGALSRRVVNRRLRVPQLARPAGPGAQLAGSATAAGDQEVVARLRRSVGVEVVIAALVIAVAALLVNAVPPRSFVSFGSTAPGAPSGGDFGSSLRAGDSIVIVTASPARAGSNELHFSILDANSQLADIPEFRAQMTLESQGLGPIELDLEKLGPGHYANYGQLIPIAGTWELTVTVRSSEIDQDQATTQMLIGD